MLGLFEEADEDDSGEMEPFEMTAFLRRLGFSEEEFSEAECLTIFAEIDTDGSGAVDIQEFYEWYPCPRIYIYTHTHIYIYVDIYINIYIHICISIHIVTERERDGRFRRRRHSGVLRVVNPEP